MNRFDREFLSRVWKLARPFWHSAERPRGLKLLVAMLVIGAASIGLGAYFTFILRDVTNALVAKDAHKFYHLLLMFFAWLCVMVPVAAFQPWLFNRLAIVWRQWMTMTFVTSGFDHRAFYRMSMNGKVDNPDQRISEDINGFVTQALLYFLIGLGSIVTSVIYLAMLVSISWLVAVALVAYAFIGSLASILIGRRLIGINFNQRRYEADFRFGLVHVRDNIEPIFMYGGEAHETAQLATRFGRVVENFRLLILWQRHLQFVRASYDNLIGLLPYIVLAGTYFAGKISYGQIVQAASVFGILQGALSFVVMNFEGITSFAAIVKRLGDFADECETARVADLDGARRIETVEAVDRVAFENLTIETPGHGRTLLEGLTLSANEHEPLLVKGPSGTGKTSLMRALAGIWREGGGTIVRPALADVMFLPQRPYMILGTLRDQLCYPRASGTDDAALREVLKRVNLADLPDRMGGLDVEVNWADVLSVGEQQRLAFARLMLNRPRFAFLDEATSALDTGNETRLYEMLAHSGIRFMSAGHRATLTRFHRSVLSIDGGSKCHVEPSGDYEASQPPA
jgi:putative ATP-binding cassette transporter